MWASPLGTVAVLAVEVVDESVSLLEFVLSQFAVLCKEYRDASSNDWLVSEGLVLDHLEILTILDRLVYDNLVRELAVTHVGNLFREGLLGDSNELVSRSLDGLGLMAEVRKHSLSGVLS